MALVGTSTPFSVNSGLPRVFRHQVILGRDVNIYCPIVTEIQATIVTFCIRDTSLKVFDLSIQSER